MSEEGRRLAAIMFTDMVGYTTMTQSNEVMALELLEEHRELVRRIAASYHGQEIKTIGDAFLIEFRSTLEAVRCALDIQEAIERRNLESAPTKRFEVRIGIHVGDVVGVGGDVYGDTVNLASRIEPLAEPGGIVISSQVYEQVHNKISVKIEKLGEYELKNLEAPVLVYGLSASAKKQSAGAPAGFRSKEGRIAILPFVNIGSDPSNDYIADGLTEELISALSRLPRIRVVARTSVMKYKGTDKPILQIGSELGVGTVMEGSVRKHAEKLRVTVQLIDATKEEYLWSESYDRTAEDMLSVQQDIAEKAVEALKPRFEVKDDVRLRPGKTANPKAFLLYLRGKYLLARHSESEVRKAADLFRSATELDERFAAAYAMCAQCYMLLGFYGQIPATEGFETARPLLKKATQIDEDFDVGHMLMGRLLMDQDWDWRGAEAEFKRAIEISPNSSEAHYRYALLLNDMLRYTEALAEIQIAEELDPLSLNVNQAAGTIRYFAGRNADAIESLERAIEIDPHAALAHNNLGLARCHAGNAEEGLQEIKRAIELDPNNPLFRTDLCYAYAHTGRMQEAHELLARTVKESENGHIPSIALAGMYGSLGDNQKAIEWLRKAFAEHSPYLSSLKVERWFDGIRADPGYLELVRAVGLP